LQPSTTIKTKGGKCYRYMIASVGLDMRCWMLNILKYDSSSHWKIMQSSSEL
jgi:hypothetical protein